MAGLYASDEDVQGLTGYKQPKRQIRALVYMGVPHRVAPDGRPRVLVSDLAPDAEVATKRKRRGPNLAALEKIA